MTDKQLLNEVILAYRKVIEERYEYEKLKVRYDLPESFDEAKVEQFRNYFLDYIYPHPDQRVELEEAFDSLDSYIKQPEKLLRIIMDSGRLLFKYGRHLPKILRAGIDALRSFRTATQFENMLVQKAIEQGAKAPFSIDDINGFIGDLPRESIEQFIDNSQKLLETVYDRILIEKILEIVNHLISKMKERPNLYTPIDIKGMEIGRDIIDVGNQIFDQVPVQEQQNIFDTIIQIERDVLDDIFEQEL